MIQARKLKQIVTHASQETLFYNLLYKKANVEPQNITDIQTIKRLPIITKEQIRNVPLEQRTAKDTDVRVCISKTTSGSTGIPITVLEDPYSASYLDGLHLRRLWSYGARPWHRVARIVTSPRGEAIGESLADKGGLWGSIRSRKVARLSLAVDIDQHLQFFSRWKPDVLAAPPSYFRALIRIFRERGQSCSLKVAITWGEILDDSTRRLIHDSLAMEVFDGYGCTEVAPIGGLAWECPTHYGYHINIDSVVLEFLRNEEPVSPGETGSVCATSLFRMATPMIRYHLGDMATPIDDECPCGRGLPLLKNIQGRVVDFIITPEGHYISPYKVMYSLQDVQGLSQYKVTQRKDYSIEVLAKASAEEEPSVLARLKEVCNMLYGSLPVDIRVVDRIELSSGTKFRVVESHVPKSA